jgi:hypothetical protein
MIELVEIPDDVLKAASAAYRGDSDDAPQSNGAKLLRIALAILTEREACARRAFDAALYSGCPFEPIAQEIADAVGMQPIAVPMDAKPAIMDGSIVDRDELTLAERQRCADLAYGKDTPAYVSGMAPPDEDGLQRPCSPYDHGRYDARMAILGQKRWRP